MPPLSFTADQKTLRSPVSVWNALPYVSAACAHIVSDVGVMPILSSAGVNSVLFAVVVTGPLLELGLTVVFVWPFLVVVTMTLPPRSTVVTLVPSASVFVIGTASADADGLAAACGAADAAPLSSRAVGGGGAELHAATSETALIARSAGRRSRGSRREGLGMGPPGCGGGAVACEFRHDQPRFLPRPGVNVGPDLVRSTKSGHRVRGEERVHRRSQVRAHRV